MEYGFQNKTEEKLEEMHRAWGRKAPVRIDRDLHRGAAVMILLVPGETGPEILFEIRAGNVAQPGEVCFPGGAIEEGETPREAAVRETAEELLVRKKDVRVLSPMHEMGAHGGRTVWSYLACLREYHGTFDPEEVAEVFTIPLAWFLDYTPEEHTVESVQVRGSDYPYRLIPGGEHYPFRGSKVKAYFYHCSVGGREIIIWGMTAKLLHEFIERYRKDITAGGR